MIWSNRLIDVWTHNKADTIDASTEQYEQIYVEQNVLQSLGVK